MKYIKGDLINLFKNKEFDYIAHQCNCRILGESCSGIARAIFDNYPESSKLQDEVASSINPYLKLGQFRESSENVINLYSQFNPGSPTYGIDSLACRISYLSEGFKRINKCMDNIKLGIPLIASGLAKDKNSGFDDLLYFQTYIEPLVRQYLININVTVVIYDK